MTGRHQRLFNSFILDADVGYENFSLSINEHRQSFTTIIIAPCE